MASGILGKLGAGLINALGGNLAKDAFDMIKAYFPPDMSPEKQAEIKMQLQELEHRKKMDAQRATLEIQQEFNKRIKDMEGTASDLKSIWGIGHIILLLRGAQRPVWGFLTIYMDVMVFSKAWSVETGSTQAVMLLVINILVLGFLFGERAVQNIMPLVIRFFGIRAATNAHKNTDMQKTIF